MHMHPSTSFVLMCILILSTGCASTIHPESQILIQNPDTLIRLDVATHLQGPDDPESYTHPVTIKEGQLRTIFDGIRVQAQRLALQKKYDGTAEQYRVFETTEIDSLVPVVKDALLKASSMEQIIFAITTNDKTTMGEIYVKNNYLHFILHCYRRAYGDLEQTAIVSRCKEERMPQGFELSFLQKDFLVGFGKSRMLLGHGTKELVINFHDMTYPANPGSS